MNWINAHIPHMLGGGGLMTLLIMTFKDSIKEMWQEWHVSRRAAREAHAATSGKDSQLAGAFISLLKSDLESQAKTRDEMAKAIGQLARSMEQVLDTQRVLSNQINDMNKDLLMVKGAVLGRIN